VRAPHRRQHGLGVERADRPQIEDLDLDSIDAIDLASRMETVTGRSFDEASLRKLRTIQDIIAAIQTVVGDGARRERIPA
jgi:acyl carrier protein